MPYIAEWTELSLTRAEVESLPGLTLLEFGVATCPHCQESQPALERSLRAHPRIRHLKTEDGKGRPLGRAYGVKLWPNFVFLRDGRVVGQLARPEASALHAAIAEFEGASG